MEEESKYCNRDTSGIDWNTSMEEEEALKKWLETESGLGTSLVWWLWLLLYDNVVVFWVVGQQVSEVALLLIVLLVLLVLLLLVQLVLPVVVAVVGRRGRGFGRRPTQVETTI